MDKAVAAAIVAALAVGLGLNACTTTMDEGATTATAAGGPIAYAQLKDKDGAAKGRATARPMGDGVHVEANLENLPPGTYAVHVHSVGRCDAPDFTSAGPHWNPEGRQHGVANPAGPHKGDLANAVVGAGGGKLAAHIPGVSMTGVNALLDADGAALVVHAGQDDNRSDPAGNAGARIACGVFSAGS